MNKGISVKMIEEINATMERNAARAEKVKGYFMNMFKQICSKYDMGEEYIDTMNQRRQLAKSLGMMKQKNQDWAGIVSRYNLQKNVGEGTTIIVKDAFEDKIKQLEQDFDD